MKISEKVEILATTATHNADEIGEPFGVIMPEHEIVQAFEEFIPEQWRDWVVVRFDHLTSRIQITAFPHPGKQLTDPDELRRKRSALGYDKQPST